MLTEAEKRAVRIAISRYGADRTRVEEVLQAIFRARGQGKNADLYDALVHRKLLTSPQADELRASLDSTHLDPNSPIAANGKGRDRKPQPERFDNDRRDENGNGELRSLGEYRILRRLGEGGMGAVYLGYQESEDRKVAIKVLADHLVTSQPSIDRFYREAKSGALLNHPNIVRNINVGQDRATAKHYLVLEYVDGPSAHALLSRHGRLAVGDAVHIVLDIAKALEHAHSRNIVHRDIKPDNILITRSGVSKLADLGLAKRTDEASHLTATRQGFGTPYYMPYEQAMNARNADGRSDIYALGATLYHLVCGEVPFPGVNHLEILDKKNLGTFPPASSVHAEVPRLLDEILERMLARDPQDRYQTASELIVDLEHSNLAAAVPSFADAELALQDPVVRERLNHAAQPTSPDVRLPAPSERPKLAPNVWYLRYRNPKGQLCKAKATTGQIVQRLREGRLPRDVEASRDPQDKFRPLKSLPEFCEVRTRPKPPQRKSSPTGDSGKASPMTRQGFPGLRLWWMMVGLGVALALGTILLLSAFWTV